MEKFKSIIRDYPFIAFIIAFVILAFVPSVVFTDVYQSHLATLIFVNIVVAAGPAATTMFTNIKVAKCD